MEQNEATIIYNRPLRLWPPKEQVELPGGLREYRSSGTNALAAEQLQLVQQLRALSGEGEALTALLEHPDPKVRTLALGAIFQREDGHDLPLLARLIDDPATTFPNLHESDNAAGGRRPISELEDSQTVGEVAQAMLVFWGVPHTRRIQRSAARLYNAGVTTNDFAQYWKKYEGRPYSASWFVVKMNRATRQTIPIQPEYRPDIQRVLTQMHALPMPDRAWIELCVLAPPPWLDFEPADRVATAQDVLAMAKSLAPELLVRFLKHGRISDDPDLQMGGGNPEFVRISNFILRHADALLRSADAEVVLSLESPIPGWSSLDPAWAIGASLLQPARADEILRSRLERRTGDFGESAGHLAGALWRLVGPRETSFLVNWFYTNQAALFLYEVLAAA